MASSSAARKRNTLEQGIPLPPERQRPQLELLPENKTVRRHAPAKVPYVKYAAILCCVFAAAMFILMQYTTLTELTSQNAGLKNQLAELQSQENALNAKREQMYNLTYVEQRAQDLGMVKQSGSQVTYVDLSSPEHSSMTAENEQSPALFAGVARTFNAVVEYLN